MNDHDDLTATEEERILIAAATSRPTTAGPAAGPVTTNLPTTDGPTKKVSKSFILWLFFLNFGASMAFIVPMSYSLALRIQELAPGHEEYLGYATGIAQVVFIVTSPLVGIWSDRTRTRLGRRKPFIIGGIIVGLLGLLVIGLSPSIPIMIVGWVIAMLGWANVGSTVLFIQADQLPEIQRGRVSALTGVAAQVAPIIGIGLVYAVVNVSLVAVFLLPGIVGGILALLFVFFGKDPDSRNLPVPTERISLKKIFGSFVFNPRKYPDFGWNWLGRFVFFVGLYFNTTFGTFFYSQRLGVPVSQVAGLVAIIGLLGIVAAVVGAIGGGWLSDKLGRRKLFVAIGAGLFAIGAVIEATAYAMPNLIAGAVVMNLALAAFGAVDQAIVMAILPDRAEAGRYMAVVQFAQKIPSGIAPLIASVIITIGAVEGVKNYTLLYLIGGACAVLGGLIILLKVKAVR
ncbi:MFS transporter [Microbacterium sp. AZCO]|uniref:MFS transporter n=1 Tax=Microbacterium sp. AZCO TaxID=3142976 RepID=UPI0031F3BAF1